MVYLLHFERPISPNHRCQHYIGSTDDLARRIAEHRAGRGSRLCEVALERGISFQVVRVWPGGRKEERRKKNSHGMRLCPLCGKHHDLGQLALLAEAITLDSVPELEF